MEPTPKPSAALVVTPAQAGQKLVQFLGRALGPDVPGSVFMRWIRTGQVRVDGKRAKPFDRVREGQSVRLPPFALDQLRPLHPELPADAIPGSIPGLTVLAATPDWLVLDKPGGLPVHPGSGWTDSVQTRLEQAFAGADFVPSITHRLDRDTSGALLCARTHAALTTAHAAFRKGLAAKEYLCWVRGTWSLAPRGQAVELEDLLEKAGAPGRERMRTGQGKTALLRATALVVEPGRSLLRVRLLTGRTHQIRAQLSARGHAVVGDAKYGGGQPPLYLHAWSLTLGEERFLCPPPWAGIWEATGAETGTEIRAEDGAATGAETGVATGPVDPALLA